MKCSRSGMMAATCPPSAAICSCASARARVLMRQYGAPMPAMEGHRHRARSPTAVETDQLAGFVGQHELWHLLAGLGRVLADIVLPEPIHQLINRGLKLRTEPPYRVGEGLQPLCQATHPCRGTERRLLRAVPRATSSSFDSPPARGERASAENSPLFKEPQYPLFSYQPAFTMGRRERRPSRLLLDFA